MTLPRDRAALSVRGRKSGVPTPAKISTSSMSSRSEMTPPPAPAEGEPLGPMVAGRPPWRLAPRRAGRRRGFPDRSSRLTALTVRSSYFKAGHLLLHALTGSLQLEQRIHALDLPSSLKPCGHARNSKPGKRRQPAGNSCSSATGHTPRRQINLLCMPAPGGNERPLAARIRRISCDGSRPALVAESDRNADPSCSFRIGALGGLAGSAGG
jgi:hypothetical protein